MSQRGKKVRYAYRAAVVAAVILITSVGAYAAVNWINSKEAVHDDDTGTMTYVFEAPEGSKIGDSGKLKVLRKLDEAYAAAIQLEDNKEKSFNFPYISKVEDLTIDGHEAKYMQRSGSEKFDSV